MSRSGEAGHDQGFTLVEVLVAIAIIGVVTTALLPQLIVGIRSTNTARLISQAKGVAQGEIEHMRNLPWHVAPENDAAVGDHKYYDVFDSYFPDLTAPTASVTCKTGDAYQVPATGWSGYVTGDRCDYEPGGPMYRKVLRRTSPGFMVVVDTQFLSSDATPVPVPPDPGYDTGSSGHDTPYSTRIGVTVTVLYADRSTSRPVSTYTEIAQQQQSQTRLEVRVDTTAVELATMNPTEGSVSLNIGALHLRGALANTSIVNATTAAASAGLATGQQAIGASGTVTAPTASAAPNVVQPNVGPGMLGSTCEWACFGTTGVTVPGVAADNGLPNAGSATSPVQALLTDRLNGGFAFDTPGSALARSELDLKSGAAVVGLDDQATAALSGVSEACSFAATGAQGYAGSSGFVKSTATTPASATVVHACGLSRSGTISLFPTSFAPYGVLQLELVSSSVSCKVAMSTALTPQYDFSAVVRIHDPSLEPGDGTHSRDAYITKTLTAAQAVDPLAGFDLSTMVGGSHPLSDYVASWSSPVAADVEMADDDISTLDLPGAVTVTTQPVRVEPPAAPDAPETTVEDAPEPTVEDAPEPAVTDADSAVTVTLGASSCTALDDR